MARRPLPMTPEETRGQLDVILVTGDAYVDHPSWGIAAVGRWLEAHGYSVGIIAQPDWNSPDAFRALGKPRLFFGITAGNMDSMVNRYTASRRLRSTDAYAPGGLAGQRPDRATIAYTGRARQAYPGVPVVVGGIEASLRRLVHYDFWQDKIRGSILLDAKADLLVYGMGERQIVEIAHRLDAGHTIKECRDIPGTAHALGAKDAPPDGAVEIPSLEDCRKNASDFNRVTLMMYRESNPHCGLTLMQRHGTRVVVQNRAVEPITSEMMDRLHELPYTYKAHNCYRQPIPALKSIAGSVTVNRGCSGGCSFCALTIHQGKDVTSRSADSVLRELKSMTTNKKFNGIVSDLGGPTANMFHMKCTSEAANQLCRRVSCLHPVRCKHYGTDHKPYLELLRKARNLPGIRRVFVNSGIRYDLADLDGEFVEELAEHHVQGQLSVAPEHAGASALHHMRKPDIQYFTSFMERFQKANEKLGKKQYLVPYFQCAHPGVGPKETIELALYMKKHGLRPRQVQMFMPTPATISTAIYVSGVDPYTKKPVTVAKGRKERARQRALLFYWKKEEWPHVREALQAWRRTELIGKHKGALVPPGPAYGGWDKRNRSKGKVRYDTHMGMKVERAGKHEESEENWEPVACG
ncbi:MAG: YgiQ family radical SAM protein [Proteobacteria bacterium]|nr:YgiQ family radical SAM protein [Pseudomonadota bacterium]MCP4918445.1 YgiQ family radical SAM protein [Pseudomonadota bacterium]